MSTVCKQRSVSGGSDVDVRDRFRFYHCRLGNNRNQRCGSGNCSNGGVRHPSFRQLLRSVGLKLVGQIVICGLSQVDHSVISFTGLVRLFGRCSIRFISYARGFSASAPVNQTVLGVYVIFTRLRQRDVRVHIRSTFCSQYAGNCCVQNQAPCNFSARPVIVSKVGAGGLIRAPRVSFTRLVFRVCTRPNGSCNSVAQCFIGGSVGICSGTLRQTFVSGLLEGPICIRTSVSVCRCFGTRNMGVRDPPRVFAKSGDYCLCRNQRNRRRVLIVTPRRKHVPSRL